MQSKHVYLRNTAASHFKFLHSLRRDYRYLPSISYFYSPVQCIQSNRHICFWSPNNPKKIRILFFCCIIKWNWTNNTSGKTHINNQSQCACIFNLNVNLNISKNWKLIFITTQFIETYLLVLFCIFHWFEQIKYPITYNFIFNF